MLIELAWLGWRRGDAQPNVALSSHFSPKGEELLLQQLNQLLVLVDGLDGLLQRRVRLELMVAVSASRVLCLGRCLLLSCPPDREARRAEGFGGPASTSREDPARPGHDASGGPAPSRRGLGGASRGAGRAPGRGARQEDRWLSLATRTNERKTGLGRAKASKQSSRSTELALALSRPLSRSLTLRRPQPALSAWPPAAPRPAPGVVEVLCSIHSAQPSGT